MQGQLSCGLVLLSSVVVFASCSSEGAHASRTSEPAAQGAPKVNRDAEILIDFKTRIDAYMLTSRRASRPTWSCTTSSKRKRHR